MRFSRLILPPLALLFAARPQSPVGLSGPSGRMIDYWSINASPDGDTWYTQAYGANSLIAAFPGTWPDTSVGALPLITVANDTSAGACGSGNIILYQVSKLPAMTVAPTSGNTNIAVLNCMSSFGGATQPNAPTGWLGDCAPGDRAGCTWKGPALTFSHGILWGCPYRQDSPGTEWGGATCIASPDAGHTWIDYERYHRHTTIGATCSANVVTMTGTNTMAGSGQVYVHGVSPVGYNGMHTVTGATGSQITYSVTSCPGAYVSGGQFGPMATDGSAPVPPSDPNYSMMWPVSGGKNPMAIPTPIAWGQDGSFPTPLDSGVDPANYAAGYTWDKVRTATSADPTSRPMGLWRVPVGADLWMLEKSNWQFYSCSNYSSTFPSAANVCDVNSGSNWSSTESAMTTLMTTPKNGAGNNARECFGAAYSPAFKSYTLGCIGGTSSQYLGYWMPHAAGPIYPSGSCSGGGVSGSPLSDGLCGHDGAFAHPIGYGEVQTGSNPPSSQIRMASGGCCFHTSNGNPFFWNLQMNSGVLPADGSARRSSGLGNVGYRFTSGNMQDAISRRGPGYSLDWWFDLFDHGGNTDTGGKPQFRDLMNPARYLQVYWDDGPTGSNYSHAISLDTPGPTFADSSYTQRLQPNFTDTTVGGGSGNNSWSAAIVIKPSVINYSANKILYLTHNNAGDTPDVQLQVGGPGGSGAACVVWSAGSLCTPTGAVPANAWSLISASMSANGTGFPTTTIIVSTGGVTTEYGGVSLATAATGTTINALTKTCSSCSATPNIATGGTWWIQNRPGGNGGGLNGTASYGDLALYAGAVPGYVMRRNFQTLIADWTRVGRGVLGSSLVISAAANTPTQAVLTYTAPNTSACTVEASENGDGSYRPLVNDVNTAMYTGSASDLRAEEVTDGTTARVFVLGKHLSTYVAGDGHPYSRALQANTTHYIRVTCSGQVATTTVTTPVYPVGSSWSEAPPPPPYFDLDSTDRARTIVDPSTGTLLKPLSLPHDFIYPFGNTMGSYMTNAGFNRMCGRNLVGPGPGLLCSFKDGSGSQGMLYYVIPSTGEVRFLGRINVSDWGKIDPTDNKIYYNDGTNIMRAYFNDPTYTGVSSGATAALVTEVFMTGTPYTNAHAFNSAIPLFGSDNSGSMTVTDNGTDSDVVASSGTFYAGMVTNGIFLNGNYRVVKAYTDSTHIKVYGHTNDSGAWRLPTGFITSEGAYSVLVFNKNPNNQDGYASVAIVDMGDRLPAGSCSSCAHVIAASFYSSAPASRWCGCHNFEIIPDTAILNQEGHELVPQDATADMTKVQGHGYYYATLTATLTSGTNAVHVDGQPQAPGQPDSFLMNRAVGDYLKIGGDIYTIATITDAQNFTISPNAINTYAIGSQVPMTCFAGWLSYWKFLADPTGQDATNTNVVITTGATWPFGGHDDWSAAGGLVSGNARVTEKWSAVVGKMDTNLGTAVNYTVPTAPSFAGIQPFQFGNATMSHLSFHQRYDVRAGQSSPTPQTWFMDELPFFGGDPGNFNPAATLVSGATNLRTFNQANGLRWNPKILPIVGVSKTTTLTDISGPTSCGSACMITDSSGDNGKFCIAQAAGECYAGSVAGDVFANVTGSTGVCIPSTTVQDLCIFSHPTYSQAAWQLGNLLGTPSKQGRPVTHCLSAYRRMGDYANFKSLDDGSWGMCQWQTTGLWTTGFGYSSQLTYGVFLTKLTPYVVPDAVDRTTFIRAPISITTPGGSGIATATVEFGYLENGTVSQHYCTQRKEACVAVASTVTDANPFNWKTVDTYTKAACASSCTIMLPVIPMRTAYWQVKFYDAGGAFVQNGQSGIVNESRVVILP